MDSLKLAQSKFLKIMFIIAFGFFALVFSLILGLFIPLFLYISPLMLIGGFFVGPMVHKQIIEREKLKRKILNQS